MSSPQPVSNIAGEPAGSPRSPAAATASPPTPQEAPAPAPAPGHLPLEADDNFSGDDADSFYASDNDSETASVTSSVINYRIENGRRYHGYKAGTYYMPNDDPENDRLDLQHALISLMYDNQLYVCPAGKEKPLNRVLDAGCGTGIWAIDVADEHPSAEVIGIDLSPTQPIDVPPNLMFQVDDLEENWTFTKNSFDLIHMRMLLGAIKDWPRLTRQAFEHLAPGGYLEVMDPMNPIVCDDGTMTKDSALYKWNQLLIEGTEKMGRSMCKAAGHKQRLIDAGFVNVTEQLYKFPTNAWPRDKKYKNIGTWNCDNMLEAIPSMTLMIFTNFLGFTAAEVELLLVDVRKDMRNRNIHAYWTIHTVYGQKPE